MKALLALLLLCSTADAGHRCHTRCQTGLLKQQNRKFENESGITAQKWQTRYYRARFRFEVARKFSIWGWLF